LSNAVVDVRDVVFAPCFNGVVEPCLGLVVAHEVRSRAGPLRQWGSGARDALAGVL
jgi:hypothetical protein